MARRRDLPRPPIADVLYALGAEYVPTARGRKMRCIHPNHEDVHPSARVNHETNRYRCYVCGLAGDVFDLLMELEGLDFATAVKRAEEIAPGSRRPVSQSSWAGSASLLD